MDSKKTTDITARIKQVASRIAGIPTSDHIDSGTKKPAASDDLVASTTTTSPSTSVVNRRLAVTEIPPQAGPSRKTEFERKREDKRREEQAQATFQPKIPSSSIRLDKKSHNQQSGVIDQSEGGRDVTVEPTRGRSRFDALYNDACKRKKEGPVLKNSITDNDLTFKPAIPRRSRSLSKDRNGTWSSTEPKESVAQRLHQTKGTGREKKVETTSAQKEEVFKPTIPKRSSSLARPIGPPVDLHTRFSKAEERRVEELDQLKAAVDANLLDPCSFVPEITKKAKVLSIPTKDGVWFDKKNVGTAADRLMQYKLDLKAKKEDMRRQYEQKNHADEPFKPTIPLRSKKVAAAATQANPGEAVHTRLAKPTMRKVTAATAAAEAAMTFQPKASKPISHSPEDHTWRDINVSSNKSMAPHRDLDKPVHERLHQDAHHKKLQLETERRLAEEQASKAFSFAPVLPVAPTTLSTKPSEGAASSTPIHERLATDNRKFMHSVLSQVHAEIELEPCTFKPNVDDPLQLAEKRAKEGPVLERLKKDEERNRRLIGLKQEEQLAKQLAELKTKPTIPDISVELAHKKRNGTMPSPSTPSVLSSSTPTSVLTKKVQSTPQSSSMKKQATPSSDNNRPGFTKQSPTTDSFHDRLSKTHTQASSPQPSHPSPSELSAKKTIVISQEESDAIVERLMASAGKHKEEIRNEIKTQVNERKFAEQRKEEITGPSFISGSVNTTPKTPQDKEYLKQTSASLHNSSGSKAKQGSSSVSSPGSSNPVVNANTTGLFFMTRKEPDVVNNPASFVLTRKGSDVVIMSPPTREARSITFVKGDIAPDITALSDSPMPDTIPHNLGLRSVVPDKIPVSDTPRKSSDTSPTVKGPEPPPQSSPAVTAVETLHSSTTSPAAADSVGRKSVSQIIAGWSPKPASGSPSVSISRTWPPVSTSKTAPSSAVSSKPISMSHQVDVSPGPLPPSTSTSSGGSDSVLHRDDSIVFAPLHNQNNSGGNKSTTYYPPPPTKYLPPPSSSPTNIDIKNMADQEDVIPAAKELPSPTESYENATVTQDGSDIIPSSTQTQHTEQDEIPKSISKETTTTTTTITSTANKTDTAATEDEIPDSTTISDVVVLPPSASPFSPSRDNATRSYSPDPLPTGWTEHLDLTSGHIYYANGSTGQSQWEIPSVPPPPPLPTSLYSPPPKPATSTPPRPPAAAAAATKSSPSPTPKRSWLGSLLGGSKSPSNSSPKK